jgi:peptide/nickel transport system permease protein
MTSLSRPLVLPSILLTLALILPRCAPFDPIFQFDPAAGRHLVPGTRRLVLAHADGTTVLAPPAASAPEHEHRRAQGRSPAPAARSVRFVLGTDHLGRDCLSRLLYGARLSLLLGLACSVLSSFIGLVVGMVAALSRPVVDATLMRLTDACMAFPKISIVLLAAAALQPGTVGLAVLLAATGWMATAKVVRGEVRALLTTTHVTATRAIGVPPFRLAWRHLLPHVLPTLAVVASLQSADMIVLESSLSFLGFGPAPATPSWGRMIADGAPYLTTAWWVSTLPAVCLAGTVVSLNLSADHLRRRLARPGAGPAGAQTRR